MNSPFPSFRARSVAQFLGIAGLHGDQAPATGARRWTEWRDLYRDAPDARIPVCRGRRAWHAQPARVPLETQHAPFRAFVQGQSELDRRDRDAIRRARHVMASLTGFVPTDAPQARRMPEDRQWMPATERSEGASVEKGRLVLNEPTTLPEGTVVDLVADDEVTISPMTPSSWNHLMPWLRAVEKLRLAV
jgi:hypothetical protein